MTIYINYKKNLSNKIAGDLVFFVYEKFNVSTLKKYLLSHEYSLLLDLIKTKVTQDKIIFYNLSSKKRIILVYLKKMMKFQI